VILATTGPVWSLSLAGSATYPLASSRAKTGARRSHGASALVGALLAIFFFPTAAQAISLQGKTVVGRWKSMDKCAAEAQRAYPDFTAEANAKRDAKLRDCLAGQNLPPREAAPPAQ
jgi:hypothetical protein